MSQQVKVYRALEFYLAGGGLRTLQITPSTNGARLESDDRLEFRDAALFIYSSTDGQMDIGADTTLTITAPTITIVGDIGLTGDIALADEDVSVAYQDYIYLDGDGGGEYLRSDTTDYLMVNATTGLKFAIAGTAEVSVSGAALYPSTDNGQTLGILSSNEWSDLFLASGGVIGWNNNDVTITHSADTLTIGGGNLTIGAGYDIAVAQGRYIRLDGQGGGERIYSQAAGKITIRAGGTSYDDLTLSCATLAMDNIRLTGTKKLEFRDSGIYLYSSEDGGLNVVADSYVTFQSTCRLSFNSTIEATSSTVGSAKFAGGIAVAKKLYVGSDFHMASGKKIDFASDITLTHSSNLLTMAGGNLRMGTTDRIEFRDATESIYSSENGIINIGATSSITMTSTLIYCNAYLVLRKTDSASSSQGALWMHETGDLLKYRTATHTRTIVNLEEEQTFLENMNFTGNKRLKFRDDDLFIYSDEDGILRIVSDSLVCVNGTLSLATGYLRLFNTGTPGSVLGEVWFDTGDNKIHFWNGSAEETVTST